MLKIWKFFFINLSVVSVLNINTVKANSYIESPNACAIYLDQNIWKLIRDGLPAIFEKENDPTEVVQVSSD